MTAGALLGWTPHQTYRATLPELLFTVAGYQRARGVMPSATGMTHSRLKELHERHSI